MNAKSGNRISQTVDGTSTSYCYDYTGSGDGASYVRDNNWNIAEKYVALPGGVTVTIRLSAPANQQKTYSLPNIHGDSLATTNAAGALIGVYTYDPYGNALAGFPNNTSAEASLAWEGASHKMTETSFVQLVTQMGARAYLPYIGRFASLDPVAGGNANAYVYALDLINSSDLSGDCNSLQCAATISYFQPAATVAAVQPTINSSRVQSSYAVYNVRIVVTVSHAHAAAASPPPPVHSEDILRYALPAVNSSNITNIKYVAPQYSYAAPAGGGKKFDYLGAASSTNDYYNVGKTVGSGGGCVIGAAVSAIAFGPEVAEGVVFLARP